MAEVLKYDNLLAGDVDIVTQQITIDVSQTIQRGDILKKVSGKFQRPSAVITSADVVVVASEDITTDENNTVSSIGYKTGQFDSNAMRFGGSSTSDDNLDVLAEKSIYLIKSQRN
ncbi:hypothetical protein [Clostridium chromiireducens]|uniref:Uncharacterized protein n=1 Tax=Clostridium chromiireducens TaxID=225345 RepID=A0A1V4IUW4_9CLOT|nr:hypothetical protein [Clostridium chromiireducens]OPJ63693.1 hypothetical protein CLCHR_15080 [Clostridium chromiireducens]